MKILKRNQLIILVISLMLVTAGYLNFTSTNAQDNTKETVAELGDATLVNSNKIENENVVENSVEQETPKEEKTEEEEVVKPTNAETTPKEDTYFTTSKLERENIYSQMLETYQEIYNNANSTQEQKEKYHK